MLDFSFHNDNPLLFASLVLLCLIYLFLVLRKVFRLSKHKRNIKKSRKIIKKINAINFPGARLNYLRKINPFVFEEIILTSLKNKGYKIIRNKKYTVDGGIDGRVFINNKLFLIQAKRYSNSINPQDVINFHNTIIVNKAHGGLFVHTGRTGQKSLENKQPNIEFISGNKLLNLISYGEK